MFLCFPDDDVTVGRVSVVLRSSECMSRPQEVEEGRRRV